MRYVSNLVTAAALAGTVAGCQDPHYSRYGYAQDPSYPRYGYSQASYYPSSYSQAYYYPSGYTYYPPPSYGYGSHWDYYRNYNGIHPGPEGTYP
jgi:hypothetical protein